ncbi:MAG TPA: MBL fold metallo-hydrolase [Bacillota bacterium]|nr:MBL fold metallo-hydrolase [Bacillota bacterium]
MRLAEGVEMLEIAATIMGRPTVIYPVLIWDNDTVILVDAGYPGQLAKFEEAFANVDVPFSRLNKVIITHQDIDHIGSLASMVAAAPQQIEVLAHAEEKPYIQGDKPLVKVTPEVIERMNSQLSALSEEQRKAIISALKHPPQAKVNRTLADGEELPYCGGIVVLHTPGHTPGHICLYLKKSKVLITGDAMNIADGQLVGPAPQHSLDPTLGMQSLKKLAVVDIDKVVCYHGGLYQDNPQQRIAQLTQV